MVKRKKRVWALLLSAALVTTQLPSVAMAENKAPEDGSIASFKALDGDVEKQTVTIGTELSELKLPDTLEAKLYHVYQDTVIPEEDDMEPGENNSVATPSEAKEKGAGGSPTGYQGDGRVKNATIPVTWDSDPVYDSHVEGSYTFTADVGTYALSDGVKPPSIIVTVEKENLEEAKKEAPCTLTEGCTLPDGHEGGCIPPADNSLIKTITSWTFVDDGVLDEGELALPGINKENQADFDMVVKLLPTQIRAVVEGREAAELPGIYTRGRELAL